MNDNMKEYTKDVEQRLERAMTAVGGRDVAKKYGFEHMGAKNADEFYQDKVERIMNKETQAFTRKLIKMQNHASSFIKNSDT